MDVQMITGRGWVESGRKQAFLGYDRGVLTGE